MAKKWEAEEAEEQSRGGNRTSAAATTLRSYSARLSGSESVAYAACTRMNSSADAPPALPTAAASGWHARASLLYAALISWAVAPAASPSTSYRVPPEAAAAVPRPPLQPRVQE